MAMLNEFWEEKSFKSEIKEIIHAKENEPLLFLRLGLSFDTFYQKLAW